jgi:hypothetical protein
LIKLHCQIDTEPAWYSLLLEMPLDIFDNTICRYCLQKRYKNGKWEFNKNGMNILKEYYSLGGITEIAVDPKNWKVSDDTGK